MVVSTAGGLTLSRRLALGAATARQLEDAFQAGLPVEGKVERAVKGGYEVRIARQRAFCPISRRSTSSANTDPAQHEGRVYTFRIIEYKEGGRNLVVSRRVLLEEEQQASAADVRKSIVEGAVMTGRVASVREFGAFVDLGGGVQGLLHVSEMAWARVSDTSQVVKPGDEITVKVLRVDADKQKISLGSEAARCRSVVESRATPTRPASCAPAASHGSRSSGRSSSSSQASKASSRLSESGIARDADVKKAFRVGGEVQVVVVDVDAAARRIRLSVTAVEKVREADEVRSTPTVRTSRL